MNVSYRWIRALCPELELSPEETSELLALRGAPVEDLIPLAPGLDGLVVARVEKVEPHPDSDHLTLCRVNWGREPSQVVCGAPNVRTGGTYPFAPVGARLPGGQAIGAVEIRGVKSQGMLCSEAELGMGPDQSGLLELPGSFDPGQPLAEAMGMDDWRLDVEVTANRGDLLSHVGVARELVLEGESGVQLPLIPGGDALALAFERDTEEAASEGVRIRIDDPDLCPRYLGAVVRGVKVGPSPAWLASRLRAAGARPINNVVDATNYVLLELGQPLHAFDLSKLGGSAIVVRRAREGELIRTLDGEDRRLQGGMLAICDASDPVAIAGVMGGADSEVDTQSTDILLECALFDPKSVRSTRSALEMSTDASYRFERGVDPQSMETAVRRALEIILSTAGGELDPGVLDVCPRPWEGLSLPLRPGRVERVLGVRLTPPELGALLTPLGFEVLESSEEVLRIGVPGFRSYDVLREVDLIEEVARTYGYDRFPEELGPFRPGTVPDHPLFLLEDELRDLLVGDGFFEAQTQTFAPEGEGEVELANPISVQEAFLRGSLLPGLLRRMEYNLARGVRNVRLFEVGTVFGKGDPGEAPSEEARLGVVLVGHQAPLHWEGESRSVDWWGVKGLLERLGSAVEEGSELVEKASASERFFGCREQFIEAESFTLLSKRGDLLGVAGRIDSGGLDLPAWAGPVFGIEVALPSEPMVRRSPIFQQLPAFPAVERDIAVLLPDDLPARRVEEKIRLTAGALLSKLEVFDLYEGQGIPVGHRSVAFRLQFRSSERTLTDSEVEEAMSAVIGRLREELGVETRG